MMEGREMMYQPNGATDRIAETFRCREFESRDSIRVSLKSQGCGQKDFNEMTVIRFPVLVDHSPTESLAGANRRDIDATDELRGD